MLRTGSRQTEAEVMIFGGGILRVAHNWGKGKTDFADYEARQGVYVKVLKVKKGEKDRVLYAGISPAEARVIGANLILIADEVDARVAAGS